ncbi:MAG TPA: HAMP domain-containing sensor histidine kinase [Terriglobia bacterium]|jgi:signal transduction histidine kinase
MRLRSRRKSIVFFIAFGASLVVLATALNVGWVILNWRQVALLVFGVVFFMAIIIGIALNTIFLVNEIHRNEQHDGFINAVTHELKTPIASIRLYLETLQTRDVDEIRRKEFYSVMLMESDRLLRTVEQVLQAGRTRERRRQIDRSVIDLGGLVQECLQTIQAQLNRAVIQYSERLESDMRPFVTGDRDELRAAVSNVVDNALKYSSTSPVAVEVAAFDEKRLAVRVTDGGIGIPRNQLKRVFKRFYRIPSRMATQVKGSGLGLFIVRSVVERHGGRVFAESEGEGKGSTFTIVLPRA